MRSIDETLGQLIRTEHYRLHCAEQWPESTYKNAVLAAVHSTLESLAGAAIEPLKTPLCMVCAARTVQARVIMFPPKSKQSVALLPSAA